MDNIILDENIDQGIWPVEFSGAWINIFKESVGEHTVLSLYFNLDNPEGSIIYGEKLENLPSAYVSWDRDGRCIEVFVESSRRRTGIGRTLCAYARSIALKDNIIFHAPEKMSEYARMMYENISEIYGEPFNNPDIIGSGIPYGYWGGIFTD